LMASSDAWKNAYADALANMQRTQAAMTAAIAVIVGFPVPTIAASFSR